MSAITLFLELQQARHDGARRDAEQQMANKMRALVQDNENWRAHLEKTQEHYLAFMEPLVLGLGNMPDDVTIQDVRKNQHGEIEVMLDAAEGVSIANLVLDYPPLPFQVDDSGTMQQPGAKPSEEALYSGLLLNSKHLYWQADINGHIVNFRCSSPGMDVKAWHNPTQTGAPLGSALVGDLNPTTPWRAIGAGGVDYWAQPLDGVAMTNMEPARAWFAEMNVHKTLREQFRATMAQNPEFNNHRGTLLLNAMFLWATSETPLPEVADFKSWAAPVSNVIVLHSVADLEPLLSENASEVGNEAQQKLLQLSRHLPNIWALTDEKGLLGLCDAMATVRDGWGARLSGADGLTR